MMFSGIVAMSVPVIVAINFKDSLFSMFMHFSGLVLMLIIPTVFICSIFGRLFCIVTILLRHSVRSRLTINLVLGLACCIPLFISAVVLYIFRSKTMGLPSGIEVEKGEVSEWCLGALCCAIVMTLLTALTSAII
jgi:hypothetical protein